MLHMGALLGGLLTLMLDFVVHWFERIISGDAFRRERS
jgi:hypothetical protein